MLFFSILLRFLLLAQLLLIYGQELNMDENFINKLPALVRQGKITLDEGRNILWTDIHRHPFFYGIATLSEDQRSEFLIWMRNNMRTLIAKFRDGPVPFRNFARICVWRSLKGWFRKEAKKNARDSCLPDSFLAGFAPDIEESGDEIISAIERNSGDNTPEISRKLSEKQKRNIRNLIHIFACKSCNELDEQMTAKLAKFLEIPEKDFEEEIELLKKATSKKKDSRRKIIERRNKAFFFHKKFEFELSKLDSEYASYGDVLKRYRKNTENWKVINEQLTHKYQAAPSLAQISRSTGIKERRVSFYLTHLKKRKDIMSFIRFPQEEDGYEDKSE